MNAVYFLRKNTGMSQNDFAEYLGIPVGTLRNWEQGICKCPPYVLKLIEYKLRNEDKVY